MQFHTNAATAKVLQIGHYTFDGSVWIAMVSKVSVYANAGVTVSLGNINARMGSGDKSLQISFTNAVTAVSGTSTNVVPSGTIVTNGVAGTSSAFIRAAIHDGTSYWTAGTFRYWQAGLNFSSQGASQQIILNDDTNRIMYRITMIVGGGYNNNLISIEVL